jgi:hypothetical protein
VDDAVAAIPPQAGTVLVGHSGAGPLLPVIADRMVQPAARLVFVDAAVPPPTGVVPLVPDDFRRALARLAVDGMLPRWSEWFGPGVTERLLPDDDQRAAVVADLPELPLSYFDGRVPLPPGWQHAGGAYILLGDLYRPEAERAASYGWPVFELDGAHLDIVTRPREVADAIIEASGQ